VINLDLRANPERFAGGDAVRLHAQVLAADIGKAAEVILSRGGLPINSTLEIS
jgi:hypothetical protein